MGSRTCGGVVMKKEESEITKLRELLKLHDERSKDVQQIMSWISGLDADTIEPCVGHSRTTGVVRFFDKELTQKAKESLIRTLEKELATVKMELVEITRRLVG
jgi:hypothetical protein